MKIEMVINFLKNYYKFFQKFHQDGAKVKKVDGFDMIKNMAANVETMMQHKIDAIKVKELRLIYQISVYSEFLILLSSWSSPKGL